MSMQQQQQQHQQHQTSIQQSQTTEPTSANSSPAKKLSKKQQRELISAEGGGGESAEVGKKAARKLKPKKKSGERVANDRNAISTENNEGTTPGVNGEAPSGIGGLSASTQANIDSTIDDLMKQYQIKKSKKVKGKKKAAATEDLEEGDDEDDGDEADEDETEPDEYEMTGNNSNAEQEESVVRKTTPRRNVKKTLKHLKELDSGDEEFNIEAVEIDSANESAQAEKKAKRRYGKKKLNDSENASASLTEDPNAPPAPILAPKADLGDRFKVSFSREIEGREREKES